MELLARGGARVGLHAERRMRKIPERVQEGPKIVADIESEKVPRAIVRWPTSSGNEGLIGTIRLGEVPRACPSRGGFSQDKELARFLLLE